MNIMEQLLKNKIFNFFKYEILKKKNDDNKIFKQLARTNYIQAINIFKNISNIEIEDVINEIEDEIKNFYKKNEKNIKRSGNKEEEKMFIYSREIAKMEYMLLKNYKKNIKLKNLYICTNCGWIGSDELVEKCPLCTRTDIEEI